MYSNAFWMMAEKFVSIIGLIFVNSYMAKYIGPYDFGRITFAATIFTFVQTLSWFGGQNVLFKRMSEKRCSGIAMALSTQHLRRTLFIFSSLVALVYLYFCADTITFVFGVANCAATYFMVMDFFATYNNTQLKSKLNTLTNIVGLLVAFSARFIITYYKLPVVFFSIPVFLIPAIPYFMRKAYFHREIGKRRILYKNIRRYRRYLVTTGCALILSTLSIVIYSQISNIFLARILSFTQLGIYNIAMTIGTAWSFVVIALITSFFTKIYEANDPKEVARLLKIVNQLVIVISLFALIGFIIFGHFFIKTLYGVSYIEAEKIVPIIIVATMFSALGTICYRYMIKYSGYRYLSYKMSFTCVLSIPLSYYMINNYGVMGAAYCFLIIEIVSCTIFNYFFHCGVVLKMHLSIFKFLN
ncbi:oligosaccharide flippase family protein [Kluyvera sp. STS39-E]|uniref:oligosaccharide flippase family protein n=1 Tax=Kluyvera sp. STS39-E TaxID=3234748 RepID=UPI0034C5FAB9